MKVRGAQKLMAKSVNGQLIWLLPKFMRKALLVEIARYGERVYRRGYADAVWHVKNCDAYSVTEELVQKFENKRDDRIFEIYGGGYWNTKMKARIFRVDEDILFRIDDERENVISEIIHALVDSVKSNKVKNIRARPRKISEVEKIASEIRER